LKSRPKVETFSELINKTTEKLQTWKTRKITKAGIIALIQKNLESMPTHMMHCFQFPSSTSKKIDNISRYVFWKKLDIDNGLLMVY